MANVGATSGAHATARASAGNSAIDETSEHRLTVFTATRTELFATASKGDGTGLKNVGGFFGIGGAKEERPSDAVLKKSALASVAKAKAAFNEYVEISNAGRPLEIDPIPSLKVRGKPPPEPVVVAAAEE